MKGHLFCASILLLSVFALRLNMTDSQPVGIYTLRPADEAAVRGDLVTFCLELKNPYSDLAKERGYVGGGTCASGLKPLLKRLAGLPGDEVEIAPDGIILNGSFMHLSFRPEIDSRGREMPPSLLQNGEIPEGLALVISQEHGNSFDSRHFGLVPLAALTKVVPVFTESKSMAMNPASGTVYQGINQVVLSAQGHDDPRWMTFNQANKEGYSIAKGAKSQKVGFWQYEKDGQALERPILNYFSVFHAS